MILFKEKENQCLFCLFFKMGKQKRLKKNKFSTIKHEPGLPESSGGPIFRVPIGARQQNASHRAGVFDSQKLQRLL
jgi:hypothetical protein